MDKRHCTAIVLAGGKGKRMGSKTQKQYLMIQGKPLIYYALHQFEESEIIDEVILVVGDGQQEYVRKNIVEVFDFSKVKKIVAGGAERYDSVYAGIQALDDTNEEEYVFIHDSARPFVDEAILKRAYTAVEEHKACVVGMPSKDTVKLADDRGYASVTPDRSHVWIIQTPQVFEKGLIKEAYTRLMQGDTAGVTDDAMVVEKTMRHPVKLVEGSYENIKVTTPEDLDIAELFVKRKK